RFRGKRCQAGAERAKPHATRSTHALVVKVCLRTGISIRDRVQPGRNHQGEKEKRSFWGHPIALAEELSTTGTPREPPADGVFPCIRTLTLRSGERESQKMTRENYRRRV